MQHESTELIDKHVGQRMRLRREALGITQVGMARRIGLTFSQIQKYENGTNRVSAGRLFEIARHLQATIAYFYDEFEENTPSPDQQALRDAFLSIEDAELRSGILALVREIAGHHPPTRRTRLSR